MVGCGPLWSAAAKATALAKSLAGGSLDLPCPGENSPSNAVLERIRKAAVRPAKSMSVHDFQRCAPAPDAGADRETLCSAYLVKRCSKLISFGFDLCFACLDFLQLSGGADRAIQPRAFGV